MIETKFYIPNRSEELFIRMYGAWRNYRDSMSCFNLGRIDDPKSRELYHVGNCTVWISRNSEDKSTITGEKDQIEIAKSKIEEITGAKLGEVNI